MAEDTGQVAGGPGAIAAGGAKSDQERLHELGYAQELKRGMGAFSNFAVSFTIISILSGCLTLFGYGMVVGGPASSAFGNSSFAQITRHLLSPPQMNGAHV